MADHDWVTMAEAKEALQIGQNDETRDDLITMAITAFSDRLDDACGPMVERTILDERHNGSFPNGRHRRTIELNHSPVKEFIEVIEYQEGSPKELTFQPPGGNIFEAFYSSPTRKEPDVYDGIVSRISNGYEHPFYPGMGNIVFSYEAGRVPSTEDVLPQYKEAFSIALKSWFRSYQLTVLAQRPADEFQKPQQVFPAFAIPNATRQMLARIWKPGVGFGA